MPSRSASAVGGWRDACRGAGQPLGQDFICSAAELWIWDGATLKNGYVDSVDDN